jgi:hypothetical protein
MDHGLAVGGLEIVGLLWELLLLLLLLVDVFVLVENEEVERQTRLAFSSEYRSL